MESNKPGIFDIIRIAYPRGSMGVLQYPPSLPIAPVTARWYTAADFADYTEGLAHYSTNTVIVSLKGTTRVITESAEGTAIFSLEGPDQGLYLPAMTWYEIECQESGSTVLEILDTLPDSDDDIKDKTEFEEILKNGIN